VMATVGRLSDLPDIVVLLGFCALSQSIDLFGSNVAVLAFGTSREPKRRASSTIRSSDRVAGCHQAARSGDFAYLLRIRVAEGLLTRQA